MKPVFLKPWLMAQGLVWIIAASASMAQGRGLDELFMLAAAHDPQVRAARQDLDAAEARSDHARSTLWPQITLNANTQWADQQLAYEGRAFRNREDRFNTHGYNLQLTQPLFRLADRAQRKGALAQVGQFEAQVRVAEMALLGRLSQAFHEACQFDAAARAAQAEVARHHAESGALLARSGKGDATEFEAAMARAQLAQARARLTETELERAQRLRSLAGMTGAAQAPSMPVPVVTSDAAAAPTPVSASGQPVLGMQDLSCLDAMPAPARQASLEDWLARIAHDSPQVRARQQAVLAARAQLEQAQDAHWFTVDAVAGKTLSQQGPTASVDVGSRTRTTSVGLQVSVPVFNGGGLTARQREAAALLGRAEAELDAQLQQLRDDASAAWSALQAALAHVDAARLKQDALDTQAGAMRKRWQRGVGKEADALAAEQELAQARGEALRHQGLAMQAYVRLLAMTGAGWGRQPIDPAPISPAPINPAP